MVDKINGNSSYDYPNQQDAKKKPGIQAYESASGRKEMAEHKSADAHSTRSRLSEAALKQKGVILDLSAKEKKETAAKQKMSLAEAVRKVVLPVIAWIKNFWESDAGEEKEGGMQKPDAAAQGTAESIHNIEGMDSVEDIQSLPPLDEVNEIPDYESMLDDALKSRDLKQMEQLLTKNGTRRLAHHSDLLTYYDRRGKLVEMDDTAKHRVLFGDKNIMKL